jgi:hypothetical protein
VIDYYQLLMAAQQNAPEGARWHHDPAVENQWRYSQPVEYVPDPQDQALMYQPITPPRRADLYEPMSAPVSAYDGMPPPEDVAAAVESAMASVAPPQMMQQAPMMAQGGGVPGSGDNMQGSVNVPTYDAPSGPANITGFVPQGMSQPTSGQAYTPNAASIPTVLSPPPSWLGGILTTQPDHSFAHGNNSHGNPWNSTGGEGGFVW